LIHKAFFEHNIIKETLKANMVPNIGGSLSTTFSLPIFGQVHTKHDITICGSNTAVRPTDLDGGTHLQAFTQLYVATNTDISGKQEQYVETIINDLVKVGCDLPIEKIEIIPTQYEWHADSTGYSGGGYQMDAVTVVMDGHKYEIGQLEIAQLNDYDQSGTLKGRSSHLIVFGLDRIINLIKICECLYAGKDINFKDRQNLYHLTEVQDQWHKNFMCRFLEPSMTSSEIVKYISEHFQITQNNVSAQNLSLNVFSNLGNLNTIMECAYASNIITSDFRNAFIRDARKIYKAFAKKIINEPDIFYNEVKTLYIDAPKDSAFYKPDPQIDVFKFVPEIAHLFPEKLQHKTMQHIDTPELLENIYLADEFPKISLDNIKRDTPNVKNKLLQLNNIVCLDFSEHYQDKKQYFSLIHSRIGSLQDRLDLKLELAEELCVLASRDEQASVDEIKQLITFYETEFAYRMHKLHPFLQGYCVATHMIYLEGDKNKETIKAIFDMHNIDKSYNQLDKLPKSTLSAISVNNIVEACLYYAVSNRNPST
ncbi:MAG: hypothetical protein AAF621_05000, partial [Pseudomonadota bacterium]